MVRLLRLIIREISNINKSIWEVAEHGGRIVAPQIRVYRFVPPVRTDDDNNN